MLVSTALPRHRTLSLPAILVVLVLAVAVALAPVFLAPRDSAAHSATAPSTRTASAIGMRNRSAATTKVARFVSSLAGVQAALDRCRGPVAWNSRGEGAPWLLFEHNYCGGAWVLSAHAGHRLTIRNGALAGSWRANGRTRVVSRGALVSTTRGLGHLVVQTCIPGTSRMRLVGFDRAG